MEKTISVRIQKEELKSIEEISKEVRGKRSEVLREIIYRGIMGKKLEIAIEKFQKNQATAWKASKIAGIPLSSFLELLAKNGIEFHYGLKELREDTADLI